MNTLAMMSCAGELLYGLIHICTYNHIFESDGGYTKDAEVKFTLETHKNPFRYNTPLSVSSLAHYRE